MLNPVMLVISVLSAGIRDCDCWAVFLSHCVQLRSHERTEARVFALYLRKWVKSTRAR
jgi:hypothetical protein